MNAYDEYLILIAPHFLEPLIVSMYAVYDFRTIYEIQNCSSLKSMMR